MLQAQENSKEKLKDIFKNRYLKNQDLSELAIAKSDLNYLLAILNEYGSFSNFEKEIGYLQRHSRERKKYAIYLTLKERVRKMGKETLRPKNVEDELLQDCIRLFGSLSAVTKKIILSTSKETILYESHTYFLTGGTIDSLKTKNEILYQYIVDFYKNIITFSIDYKKKFLLDPLKDYREEVDNTYNLFTGLSSNNEEILSFAEKISTGELIDFIILNKFENQPSIFFKKNYPEYYLAIELKGGLDEILKHPLFIQCNNYFMETAS